MRLLLAAAGILLLLVLLTWLLLRGTDTNARAYAETLQIFDDFALAERLFNATSSRRAPVCCATTIRSTRPKAMEDAIGRLRSYAQSEDLSGRTRSTAWARRWRSRRNLPSTSRAALPSCRIRSSYVGVLSTGPMFGARDAQLAPAAGAMAAAVLHLARDTSPDAVQALQERIDQFAAEAPAAGPDAQAAQALLAHTRLLRDLLPATDATLKALIAVPSRALEAIRALFADHQAASKRPRNVPGCCSTWSRFLLIVALVRLGLRLRARALALRRRAAFEHVIAENSTRLINCPPAETDARLTQVLGDLCRAIGAERGYVVLDESPTRCTPGARRERAYPPGWPDQALALSAQLGDCRPRHRHRAECRCPAAVATSRTRSRRSASASGPACR